MGRPVPILENRDDALQTYLNEAETALSALEGNNFQAQIDLIANALGIIINQEPGEEGEEPEPPIFEPTYLSKRVEYMPAGISDIPLGQEAELMSFSFTKKVDNSKLVIMSQVEFEGASGDQPTGGDILYKRNGQEIFRSNQAIFEGFLNNPKAMFVTAFEDQEIAMGDYDISLWFDAANVTRISIDHTFLTVEEVGV